MSMLRSNFYENELEKKRASNEKDRRTQNSTSTSARRSALTRLQPIVLIKDHRTKMKSATVDRVIDGNLHLYPRLSANAAHEKQA